MSVLEPTLAHIVNHWLGGNAVVKAELAHRRCTKLRQLKGLVLNEINSIKNRTVSPEIDISDDLKEELTTVFSYLNQLQLNYGPISTMGLVDHTLKSRDDFQAFYEAALPFVDYTEAKALDAQSARELHAKKMALLTTSSSNTGSAPGVTSSTAGNANPSSSTGAGGVTQNDISEFRKSVKTDLTSFQTLKYDKNWVQFSKNFKVDCDAAHLTNPMDPTYVPSLGHATTLFNEQNRVLFKILKDKIQTVKGKSIIAKHLDQRDGQKVWKELVDFYEGPGSIHGKNYLNALNAKIHTPLRPTDLIGVNIHDKLVEFDAIVTEYCDMKGTTMSSDERLVLLENFLMHIPSLKQVEEGVLINSTLNSGGTASGPDVSIELYHAMAQLMDIRKKEKVLTRRTAMVTDMLYFNHHSHNSVDSPLVDANLSDDEYYQVMQAEIKNISRDSRMPRIAWKSLSQRDQQIWDTLGPDAKAVILNAKLEGQKRFKPRQRQPHGNLNPTNLERRVPGTPIANTASINAAERSEDTKPSVSFASPPDTVRPSADTDETIASSKITAMMTRLDTNLRDWPSEWEDDNLLISNFASREPSREVFQVSRHDTFAMPNFLSHDDSDVEIGVAFAEDNETSSVGGNEHETVGNFADSSLFGDNEDGAYVSSRVERDFDDSMSYASFNIEVGPVYRVSTHDVSRHGEPYVYRVSAHESSSLIRRSMLDRGANGAVKGDNSSARVIDLVPDMFTDIQGVDSHTVNRIPIGTIGMVVESQRGPVILILHQVAILGRGRTILSCIQMEDFNTRVSDTSIRFGGQQRIVTPHGYSVPLDIVNGLVYMKSRPFTDREWRELPHEEVTSDTPWAPRVHDFNVSDDAEWLQNQADAPLPNELNFNAAGQYIHRHPTEVMRATYTPSPPIRIRRLPMGSSRRPADIFSRSPNDPTLPDFNLSYIPSLQVHVTRFTDASPVAHNMRAIPSVQSTPQLYADDYNLVVTTPQRWTPAAERQVQYLNSLGLYRDLIIGHAVYLHNRREHPIDYEHYRQFFLGVPREVVERTFEATTRYYRGLPATNRILDTRRSHFPATNVLRRNEVVATDKFDFDLAAWGGGYRCCQIFVGRSSYFISIYGMNTDGEFVAALEDEIRYRGAPHTIMSDCAQSQTGTRAGDIYRAYRIRDHQSEPHHQNQNIAERYIQEVKKFSNWIRRTSGAPPQAIYLIVKYVAFIFNRTARKNLRWRTPCEALTGQTPDISVLVQFKFWQVVYTINCRTLGSGFPSDPSEIRGHFCGYAETCGHSMTFLLWDPQTKRILRRSRIRAATDDDENHPANPSNDEDDGEDNDDEDDEPPGLMQRDWEDSDDDDSDDEDEDEDGGDDDAGFPGTGNGNPPGTSGSSGSSSRGNNSGNDNQSPRNQPDTQDDPQDTDDGERDVVRQTTREDGSSVNAWQFRPHDLLGRTTLLPINDDGTRYRAKILEVIEDYEGQVERDPHRVKFRAEVGDQKFEQLIEYNQMCELIEEQVRDENGDWVFLKIMGHSTPKKKGEKPRILVKWESGEITWESVWKFGRSSTYKWIITEYCVDNNLVDEWDVLWPGLNIKKSSKNLQKIIRHCNQAKLHSYKNRTIWMFGHEVPLDHEHAVRLDKANGNRKWQEAEEREVKQLLEYETFKDLGKNPTRQQLEGYKKITLRMVYAVKHDGRYKGRIVAGGHLTDAPIESVYSGVVSLRGVRACIFLAELNDLQVWQTDVGNAYLEAYTKEKVYVVAGADFNSVGMEGHVLIISRALYGLKSSGLRWYERFADVLREMDFVPCVAEPEVWMRACDRDGTVLKNIDVASGDGTVPKNTNVTSGLKQDSVNSKKTFYEPPVHIDDGSYYEYIAVYVDDLTIVSKKPKAITDTLEKTYKFKLKGTGALKYLLGCSYYREGNTLCASPLKYIEQMEATYERIFGEKPSKKVSSPLEKGDHPEEDMSEVLDAKYTRIYQSLIGSSQWVIALGRFDIACHVMSLSSFRACPRQGHLDRIKRVYSYLCKMRHGVIRYRTGKPDISSFDFLRKDWSHSPYAGTKEEYPKNLPPARGKSVLMTTFADANLMHDTISGRSATGVLHFLNKTPFDWFSKKQNTVETATYGSENNAARAAIEQIRANKMLMMYLGVPIDGAPILLGDNESVTNSGNHPDYKNHKRHLMLSYHYIRENVAAGCIRFAFIDGKLNPADVLSKHWAYQTVWPLIRPILFWKGDTRKILDDTTSKEKKNEESS